MTPLLPRASVQSPRLALESTLLLHGVPPDAAVPLALELADIATQAGAKPILLGLGTGGKPASLTLDDLKGMLDATGGLPKLNTSTLGAAMNKGWMGATTVSTTMELAAGMGIRVFSTGGLGGVHQGLSDGSLDISADLAAFTRFPVAVVTAGCKSILDVVSTREILETLGVPVIGFRCDRFPAFYRRDGGTGVDTRFDDMGELARFVRHEMARTRRGVVICNPIPSEHELEEHAWTGWLSESQRLAAASGATGRAVTPAVLSALHTVSGGRTLFANIELVKHNVRVGAQLATAIGV